MCLKHFISLVAVLFCVMAHAQNQQYTFSRIDVSNDLSHNQITTILKDKNGFLWFGTMSGLNRYDGYTIKTFRNTPDSNSIVDNYVNTIWEFPGNKLWIVSRNDTSVYDLSAEKFDRNYGRYLESLSLPVGNIINIKKDSKNNYWFIYDAQGIFRYGPDRKLTHFHHIKNDISITASDAITNIAEDSYGYLWLVHRNGLLEKMDPSSQKITTP